ncbi:hypothetical protein TIFTF001_010588 [Ficus carica]|uniref:LIM zinc-binding domain-containing protein n=1 Tax=Ficus carica TaxID=3494 RepID=A0AA88D3I4_FICCA|nr:hypothetical protein TIFTF001_010588 [Ficus carica]
MRDLWSDRRFTGDEIDGIWYCDRHFSENINRHLFGGVEGQCFICGKTVYLPEKLIANGLNFHRACFKCCHGCPLQVSDYRMLAGSLYCNEHKKELDTGDCSRIYNLPELIKNGIFKLEPARGRGPSSFGPKS